MPKLKEIFVVDGALNITPVKILKPKLGHKAKFFAVKINSFPVIVQRSKWK